MDKALLQLAIFGSRERIIDISPSAGCTTILVIVFVISQVGAHSLKGALSNFAKNPMKVHIVDSAIDTTEDKQHAQI